MKSLTSGRNLISQSGVFNPRALLAVALCSGGVLLAMSSFMAPSRSNHDTASVNTHRLQRYMPVPDGEPDDLNRMEQEWNNRLTYPTGLFNPLWVRLAAVQDALISRGIPLGIPLKDLNQANAPLALDPSGFTA